MIIKFGNHVLAQERATETELKKRELIEPIAKTPRAWINEHRRKLPYIFILNKVSVDCLA